MISNYQVRSRGDSSQGWKFKKSQKTENGVEEMIKMLDYFIIQNNFKTASFKLFEYADSTISS
ncbi:unnamed protein product [Paramecium octaurelia]|uniref:Uncharacterized protein n=1 Tax=Paramecium octaurelia TaxID=43137 RepID=A0A8S1YES3_PAROT|nr:unnamed protein product [Paramecium octaurelia]